MDGGPTASDLLLFLQVVLTIVLTVVSAQLKALRVEISALRETIVDLKRRLERVETELMRRQRGG